MMLSNLECVCGESAIDGHIALFETVQSQMEHPEWFGGFDRAELHSALLRGGMLWLYLHEGRPVCSMLMLIPTPGEVASMGAGHMDAGQIVDYGPMMVHPDYRGNGLQRQMLGVEDRCAIEMGRKFALTTVHPDNIHSLRNLTEGGFRVLCRKQFGRGSREICVKAL